jgi:hypothetical protein
VVHITRRRHLSHYCINLGSGGNGVRALQDVQAFENFARINGFEIYVEVHVYSRQSFVRVLMNGTKSFTKATSFKCKMLVKVSHKNRWICFSVNAGCSF